MKSIFLAAFFGFVVVSMSTISHGDNKEKARQAFDEGRALFGVEKYAEAAEQFRKAYEMRPNWKILYNIGQSEAAAGNHGAALEMFERYLATGGDNIDLNRSNELLAEIERLKKMVGYLEVKKAPPGATVLVDGHPRGETPLAGLIPIPAGVEHLVSVRKGDEVLFERELRLLSGRTKIIDLSQEAIGWAATGPEPSDEEQEATGSKSAGEPDAPKKPYRPLFLTGWSLLGVGAATLIGGAVTGGMALSKNKELDPKCVNGCPPELEGEKQTLDKLSTSTDILLGVGGGLAVTGGIILIVATIKKKRASKLALMPSIGNGMAGLTAVGEF